MVTITVVEPNTLLRLGILKLLETLDCHPASQGFGYAQLFDVAELHASSTDLMLLSAPAAYDHVRELVVTAQQRFAPERILLLSDTQLPSYSMLDLPPVLAGYVYKFASQDILKASIMLVLAGGKCFPQPDTTAAGKPGTTGDAAPGRRWYDHSSAVPCPSVDGLTMDAPTGPEPMGTGPPGNHTIPSGVLDGQQSQIEQQPPIRELTPDLIRREAAMLNLTTRQYEILALMAKGHPLKKISRELAISVATVKTHTEALYRRLGVNNRNAAVYAATSRGATLGCWNGPRGQVDGRPPMRAPADS